MRRDGSGGGGEGGEGGEDEWEDEDEERAWPEGAFHSEKSFGYPFNAGEHRIRMFPSLLWSAF